MLDFNRDSLKSGQYELPYDNSFKEPSEDSEDDEVNNKTERYSFIHKVNDFTLIFKTIDYEFENDITYMLIELFRGKKKIGIMRARCIAKNSNSDHFIRTCDGESGELLHFATSCF